MNPYFLAIIGIIIFSILVILYVRISGEERRGANDLKTGEDFTILE
jgi:hypothetical protein